MGYDKHNLTDRQNYNGIDAAKFVCSILVIMLHVPPFGVSDDPAILFWNGFIQNYLARIAVPFFFVCSGFFLYKKTSRFLFTFEPTKRYAVRLLKLYILWTVIYLPLSSRAFAKDTEGLSHAVLAYLQKCIFKGSYVQLWYLPATIFSVLLISFLLYRKMAPVVIVAIASLFYLIGLLATSWHGAVEPLKKAAPSLWVLFGDIQKVILTTRDGLFVGFLFVAIGMVFAFYDVGISKKLSMIGFSVSMVLMFGELCLLQYLHFARKEEVYVFLVPAVFFGFAFVSQVRLPDNPVYRMLRNLSSLIYYTHMLCMREITRLLHKPLSQTEWLFVCTLCATVALSYAVIRLSELPKLRWLKKLY